MRKGIACKGGIEKGVFIISNNYKGGLTLEKYTTTYNAIKYELY